ncbi:MAG: hypothetical protein ACI9KE_000147 [Polyangiales bacterium]|jgi:hypothetical protein
MTLLPLRQNYMNSQLELHYAAQLPGAASALIEPRDDYSHTTLALKQGCLVSQSLPDGRRVGVHIESLQLRVGSMDAPSSTLELKGRTKEEALAWLGSELGEGVAFLGHDLPPRVDQPFEPGGGDALEAWIALGTSVLAEAVGAFEGSPLRLWPHHFDMATLVSLDEEASEDARSINIGLSLGDGSYGEPYWYVTPWPKPSDELPPMRAGHWHTDGFVAAVLPASEHPGDDVDGEAREFLRSAVAACRMLLTA